MPGRARGGRGGRTTPPEAVTPHLPSAPPVVSAGAHEAPEREAIAIGDTTGNMLRNQRRGRKKGIEESAVREDQRVEEGVQKSEEELEFFY